MVDVTGEDAHHFGQLTLDDAYFELSPSQQRYQDFVREVNQYLREEYHALQELMWISAISGLYKQGMPAR